MFKASDDENPEQSSAECDHCAGIPQQSWGRLCPWRRGGHRQQQGRHRGGGGGLAGHVDQRLLGDGHQGQEVTQVLQAPDHPHLQVGDTFIPREGPLYQFGCRTILSPHYYGPLADSTLHVWQEEIFTTRTNLKKKSFYPEYYTIHSYSKEHLHRQSISENQSRKTSKDLMLHFWYPFILIESSYFI